ncbi:hypothetical protein [Streptomyces sp. cmx-18-6]
MTMPRWTAGTPRARSAAGKVSFRTGSGKSPGAPVFPFLSMPVTWRAR